MTQKEEIEAKRILKQNEILANIVISKPLIEGNVEEVSKILTETISLSLDIDRVSVWLFNDDSSKLICVDLFEKSSRKHSSKAELSYEEFKNEFEYLKKSKFIDASDAVTDSRTQGYAKSYLKPNNITSLLNGVIRSGSQKVLGNICFEHVNYPHKWTADEIAFVCQIADQIGITIANKNRHLAEKELEKRTTLLSVLLDSIPDLVFFKDVHGIYLGCNNSFANYVGKSRTEIIGHSDYDLFSKDIATAYRNNDQLTLKQEGPRHNEEWVAYPNGKKILLDTYKAPLRSSTGELIGLLGVSRDITEKKRLEEKLFSTQKNYQMFFDTMDDMIFIVDYSGSIIYANNAVTRKLGYTEEELKLMNIIHLHPPSTHERARAIFSKMLTNEANSCPLPMQQKNGFLLPVETHTWLGEWTEKKALFAISKDLSKEQEALQKFDKLFSNNPALMVVSQLPERRITEVNEAFLENTGYKKEEVIGKTVFDLDLYIEEDQKRIISEHIKTKTAIRNFELKIQAKSGKILDCIFSAEFIESQSKNFLLGVMIDISNRKLAEKALKDASKMKSSFIEMMSHELRTPLATIKEAISLLIDKVMGDINEKQKNFLEIAKKNVDRLNRLITSILNLQKLESKKMEFIFKEDDINEVIKEVQSLMLPLVQKKGLYLHIDLANAPKKLKFDRDAITQVFTNLINNAISFTSKGGILIKTVLDKSALHISIIDTGIGIEKKDLEKLFTEFTQLQRKIGGTGLGLVICKKIIEEHRGKIWADSTINKGSTFHFTLPISNGNHFQN